LLNFIFHFPQKINGASEILVLFFENPNPGKNSQAKPITIISVLAIKGNLSEIISIRVSNIINDICSQHSCNETSCDR